MRFLMRSIFLLSCCLLLTQAAPRFYYETHSSGPGRSQACGDKLADLMFLVCSGRGYNVAFRPEGSHARRVRRGIVDECCHRSCSPAMLELYCLPDPTETPSNVQIRKRSDSGTESTEVHREEDATQHNAEAQNTIIHEHKTETTEGSVAPATKTGGEGYRILNLLASSELSTHKQTPRNLVSKTTPNDTTEEELNKHSRVPLLRHHRNRHHSLRLRAHKAAAKAKREKNGSDESAQTFQIGMVKPYFAGRALAAYRTNSVRHSTPT